MQVPLTTPMYDKDGQLNRDWFRFFNSSASDDAAIASAFDAQTPILDPANLARLNVPNDFLGDIVMEKSLTLPVGKFAVGAAIAPTGPTVQLTGDTAVTGNLAVSQSLAVAAGPLAVGAAVVTGGPTVQLTGNVQITGNLTVTGTETISGNLAVTGTETNGNPTPATLNVTSGYQVLGTRVVGPQLSAVTAPSNTALGSAGATYTSATQTLINNLVSTVASQQAAITALIARLQSHGLTS